MEKRIRRPQHQRSLTIEFSIQGLPRLGQGQAFNFSPLFKGKNTMTTKKQPTKKQATATATPEAPIAVIDLGDMKASKRKNAIEYRILVDGVEVVPFGGQAPVIAWLEAKGYVVHDVRVLPLLDTPYSIEGRKGGQTPVRMTVKTAVLANIRTGKPTNQPFSDIQRALKETV